MTPVKELVEGRGLLYRRAIRTNLVLERLAFAVQKAVEGYLAKSCSAGSRKEVERRVAERLAEEGVTRFFDAHPFIKLGIARFMNSSNKGTVNSGIMEQTHRQAVDNRALSSTES